MKGSFSKPVTWAQHRERQLKREDRGPGAGIFHTLLFAAALVLVVFPG